MRTRDAGFNSSLIGLVIQSTIEWLRMGNASIGVTESMVVWLLYRARFALCYHIEVLLH